MRGASTLRRCRLLEVLPDPAPVRATRGEDAPEPGNHGGGGGRGAVRRSVEQIVPRDRPRAGERTADSTANVIVTRRSRL